MPELPEQRELKLRLSAHTAEDGGVLAMGEYAAASDAIDTTRSRRVSICTIIKTRSNLATTSWEAQVVTSQKGPEAEIS